MAMAGVASASNGGERSDRFERSEHSGSCFQVFWISMCPKPSNPPFQAPEIDPASAMAGLTMLAGGLAVLRGRRKVSKEKE
jgi:hypothetical protein